MRFQLSAIVFLGFVFTDSRESLADTIVDGKVANAIQDYAMAIHQQLGFSGAILAAKDGKVILATALGTSGDGQNLDATSLFEIASCTKPFTAVAILQLVEDGKLTLDDPISKHVPGVPGSCHSITIRHLVAHTSGIPGTNSRGSSEDAETAFRSFLRGGPKHKPGSHYEYWNQGYSILSEIISRASGDTYTRFVQKRIFNPAGMTASRFTGDEAPQGLVVAVGCSPHGHRSALSHPYGSYGFQYRGMGGLVTNVHDLWKFDRALKNRVLLKTPSIGEMIRPGISGYGLGWEIKSAPDGNASHGHSGSVRGFRANIRRYPSIDGALFVLCNDEATTSLSIVRDGAEKILFGKRVNLTIPNRPSAALAESAKGSYVDSKKRRLVIGAGERGLPTLKIYWGGPVTHGFLGITANGKPALYMMSRSENGFQFKVDSEIEFVSRDGEVWSTSLLGVSPKLTFVRQD